jgi:hypothetical protein
VVSTLRSVEPDKATVEFGIQVALESGTLSGDFDYAFALDKQMDLWTQYVLPSAWRGTHARLSSSGRERFGTSA